MSDVFSDAEREDLIARFRQLYSASVYDVLWKRGLTGQCMDTRIAPLDPSMVVAGPAFTILGGPDPRGGDEYVEPEKMRDFAMLRVPEGHVVVVETSGEEIAGCWGELLSTVAQQNGARGVVVDGGTRDAPLLRKMTDWPVFARYSTPVDSNGLWRWNDFDIPITVRGTRTARIRVNPGDWIFGDEDGVLVIPRDIVMDVLIEAEEIKETENLVRQELNDGASFLDVYARFERF